MEQINWYPGHMKKTRELIQENLKMVNIVIEVIDARIPISSRNPIIDELISNKTRIIALNKSDLGDSKVNAFWRDYFKTQGMLPILMNSVKGDGIPQLLQMLEKIQEEKNAGSIRKRPLRIMIVGVPNVGKSSLINRLTGKKSAKTGNKPGVTRGKQWLNLSENMQLLDTPGILWPKFEDPQVGLKLAFLGSIKDEILDIPSITLELIKFLSLEYKDLLMNRYKLTELGETPLETMEMIAKKRGFIMSADRIDYERTSRTIIDEYRAGILGRITLERPEEMLYKVHKVEDYIDG
ncbi:MAG: ribosome biogenesis GTPase YlqF [Eubacteriales bacterium]